MSQHQQTFDDALCFPIKTGFALFTAYAVRNGAKPILTYEDQDRISEMKRTGKTWFIR